MISLDPAWVQGIAGIVQALGVIFALAQVRLLRLQITADHELARRPRAIEDVRAFASSLDRAHPSARRLVDDFDAEQVGFLMKRTPFVLPDKNRKFAEYALSDILEKYPLQPVDGGFRLNEAHLAHLLQLCLGHLNQLETALLGWFLGISDNKVVEDQFKYAISAPNGHYILEVFREHPNCRGNYPAINAFVARVRNLPVEQPRESIA